MFGDAFAWNYFDIADDHSSMPFGVSTQYPDANRVSQQ
jgi:hypothetical protein